MFKKIKTYKLKGQRNGKKKFGYEDLEVCPVECCLWLPSVGGFHRLKKRAVDFAVKVIDAVKNISTNRKHYRLLEQIEASSTSVPMNSCPR